MKNFANLADLAVLERKISYSADYTPLEIIWLISLYVTDGAIAKLFVTIFRQIEGNGKKFSHIELSISVIS